MFRGDFLGNSGGRSNQHQRSGSNGNMNSYSKTNLNLDMFMHKAGSSNADRVFVEQKRDVNRNVHHNGQSSLQNDTMQRVGQQPNRKHDEYVRKNGFFEELDRNRNDGREKDNFFENSCNEDLPKKSDGDYDCLDDLPENLDLLLVSEETSEGSATKNANHLRSKDVRIDLFRGHNVSGQRARIRRRELRCRCDIDNFTPLFLSIYASLIPADEEKRKQKQLLHNLGKLVNQEWPTAQLHLYGSCANSFGVSNSDIDLCLAIDNVDISKSGILLKLAEILEQGNLQNVQALTHARVPIVKMMDPITGISCDICINNLLAVANTKLLRDYAQIDVRLRQLAFIVKHWAKSRGVNETYRGTLSSYAYVLMCIHFLQQRRPAILPCLQEMEATYSVTIDGVRCAFFDRVDRLRNFGARNDESISRLLWGFFRYWAYDHDYMNDVISVRVGQNISKREKDWTRRIGNDRHLICIEDPFETSHDLGRVVDKYSIKILREEFERAADIMQYDINPSVKLFEPYVPRSMPDGP